MPPLHLPRIDPAERQRLSVRAYVAFLRTRVGRWTATNVAPKVDPWLLRYSRNRVGMAMMLPSTLLTTTGAKSGSPRTTAVLYFHDGADVIVIASSYGRAQHPAWFHNLTAHPQVRLGGALATASVATDPIERQRLWASADQIYPLFADYRERAARADRVIPIVRLGLDHPEQKT
jgi:deazaflavin-dependent oxidoreductase (nitroreductase family)